MIGAALSQVDAVGMLMGAIPIEPTAVVYRCNLVYRDPHYVSSL